jgi:bidirectional [NiFe] hydrogenase diaphorase subunit
MEVFTDTEKVLNYRKMILELLFAERNHVCSICVVNGHCELQSLAERLGVHHSRYAYRYPKHKVDATHSRFSFDANRCILCTRCVRVCEDVEGAKTWGISGRGIQSNVMADLDGNWGDSETCTSCSKCVHVCPTGALFEKGRATGEMVKRENILPYLQTMRANTR